jgi:hypothetical protein
MAIRRRPLVSFAIANNLLAPNIRATNLGTSALTIATPIWNNSKNPEDWSFGMKHRKRCSYTILESPFEDKWGIMVRAWANKILYRTKMCLGGELKISGRTRFEV